MVFYLSNVCVVGITAINDDIHKKCVLDIKADFSGIVKSIRTFPGVVTSKETSTDLRLATKHKLRTCKENSIE